MTGPLRNPRHERFCLGLAEGLSAYAAYEQAGYQPHDGNCIRLRGNERVQVRLAELQQAAQKKTELSIEGLVAELEEMRSRAVSLDQLAAGVRATAEKIKLSGLAVQKIEVKEVDSFDECESIEDVVAAMLKAATRNIPGAVVLPCDEARLLQVWETFEAVIDDIKGRSAKLITSPPDVERKRLFGNGRQR